MRNGLYLAALAMLVNAAALAAPRPTAPPPVKDAKALKAEARHYAVQLNYLVNQVVAHYVRPVSQQDLLEAALDGMYQAARRPAPRDLRAQVRQAVSLAGMLHAQGVREAASFDRGPVDPVEQLLVRLREQLGQPDALTGQNPLLASCRSMARLLDPHSGLVTAEEQRRSVGLDNESVGVGLELRERLVPGPLEVETVHMGGPAQRVGLRPGDVITHVDGEPVAKAALPKLLALKSLRAVEDIAQLARPEPTAEVPANLPGVLRVTYRRAGETRDRAATLLRERYRPETVQGVRRQDDNNWDYLLDAKDGIAQLRVATLSRGTSEELRDVLVRLAVSKVRGVILDLRWCPGGYLNEAVETADLFLGAGVIATVKSRNREDNPYRSTDEGKFKDFTVVVLVNGDTSGGAELIAAALQDHKRAVVVGQRTLGKASVQTPLAVGIDGVGFKLTSGTFHRPSGKNLHRFQDSKPSDDWGVLPDEDARVSAELGRRLKSWWLEYSLRPARASERLALDDPKADPQQQAALAAARKLVREKKPEAPARGNPGPR